MPDHAVLDLAGLQALVDVLRERGYTVLGPTVRDGAIVPAPVTSVDDLPRGWGDEQDGALYRLTQRDDDALFGFAAGAQSFKPVLFPAEQLMWRARRTDDGFETEPAEPGSARFGAPPYALLGVRSCDLHAIGIHDTVLLGRTSADAHYAAGARGGVRRRGVLLRPGRHLLLRLDGHRAAPRRRVRPRR